MWNTKQQNKLVNFSINKMSNQKRKGPVCIYYVPTVFSFSNNTSTSPWLLKDADYSKIIKTLLGRSYLDTSTFTDGRY